MQLSSKNESHEKLMREYHHQFGRNFLSWRSHEKWLHQNFNIWESHERLKNSQSHDESDKLSSQIKKLLLNVNKTTSNW